MPEEYINQKIRLEKIDEIRNYLNEEVNQNDLMNKEQRKVCRVLNYFKYSLIIISGCVSISAFAYLLGISIGITSSWSKNWSKSLNNNRRN